MQLREWKWGTCCSTKLERPLNRLAKPGLGPTTAFRKRKPWLSNGANHYLDDATYRHQAAECLLLPNKSAEGGCYARSAQQGRKQRCLYCRFDREDRVVEYRRVMLIGFHPRQLLLVRTMT